MFAPANHAVNDAAISMTGIRGCTGTERGKPCGTSLGRLAGNALAARTSLPGPAAGPYQAVFASTANANARRQRQQAKPVRPIAFNAAVFFNISAVYHDAGGERLSSNPAWR